MSRLKSTRLLPSVTAGLLALSLLSGCGGKERPKADLAASQVTTIGVNSYLWLRVAASRQIAQNGTWVDAPVKAATTQKLEQIILTKARDLRRGMISN